MAQESFISLNGPQASMKKFSLFTENIRSLRTLALAQGRGMQFVRPLAFGDVPDVLWEELHISGMACWR
jgi:hypothetical protein